MQLGQPWNQPLKIGLRTAAATLPHLPPDWAPGSQYPISFNQKASTPPQSSVNTDWESQLISCPQPISLHRPPSLSHLKPFCFFTSASHVRLLLFNSSRNSDTVASCDWICPSCKKNPVIQLKLFHFDPDSINHEEFARLFFLVPKIPLTAETQLQFSVHFLQISGCFIVYLHN